MLPLNVMPFLEEHYKIPLDISYCIVIIRNKIEHYEN